MIKKYWQKLPSWGQWLAGVGGGIAVLYSAAVWSADAIDKAIVTEDELNQVSKTLRIQLNSTQLTNLQRDLIGEKYANDGEKEFIVQQIQQIQQQLKCDQQNICAQQGQQIQQQK